MRRTCFNTADVGTLSRVRARTLGRALPHH
jgi:hypothetical protein